MSRLTPVPAAGQSPAQRALREAIEGGKRASAPGSPPLSVRGEGLRGPFEAWLRAPELGLVTQRLGEALRFEGALPDRQREIAILQVAAHCKARFEWWAHARIAAAAGVEERIIAALHAGARPALRDPHEALVHDLTAALLEHHRLPDALYARGVAQLGEAALAELVMLVGYYLLVAMTLNAFDVDLPAGQADPFPPRAPEAATGC